MNILKITSRILILLCMIILIISYSNTGFANQYWPGYKDYIGVTGKISSQYHCRIQTKFGGLPDWDGPTNERYKVFIRYHNDYKKNGSKYQASVDMTLENNELYFFKPLNKDNNLLLNDVIKDDLDTTYDIKSNHVIIRFHDTQEIMMEKKLLDCVPASEYIGE